MTPLQFVELVARFYTRDETHPDGSKPDAIYMENDHDDLQSLIYTARDILRERQNDERL